MVIQYGQTIYSTLTEAIQSINLESFTTYVNLQNDAILIGILSIAADTDDLTKWNSSTYTRMLLVSKFGESVGASGGAGSVGTLQQAYDNSTSPHIEINSITDGLTIQDGVDATVKPLMKFKDYAEVERARINSDGTVGFKESAGTDS